MSFPFARHARHASQPKQQALWPGDSDPPAPPAAGAEVPAAGLAAAGSNFEAESPMLLVNPAPGDGPSQFARHASEDNSTAHRQAQAICDNLPSAGSEMVHSPGLWQFLHEEELQNGCFVKHIALNYWGTDRPKSGKGKFKKWLKTLSFLEVYTDASGELCVRLASSSAAFQTAHCSSSVNELGPQAQDCAASAGQSQQPQKTPGHAVGATSTKQSDLMHHICDALCHFRHSKANDARVNVINHRHFCCSNRATLCM